MDEVEDEEEELEDEAPLLLTLSGHLVGLLRRLTSSCSNGMLLSASDDVDVNSRQSLLERTASTMS